MRSTDWNGSVSAFYSISIDKKLDDKDLIVIVKGASPHSDPDVLISTEH